MSADDTATAQPRGLTALLYNSYHCSICGEHLRPDWRVKRLYHVSNDTDNPCPNVGKVLEMPVVELKEMKP